jgi:hypothetical protein
MSHYFIEEKHGPLDPAIRIFEAINQNMPDCESLHNPVFSGVP